MSNEGKEWICLNCNSVFISMQPKCCGAVEPFILEKHGGRLISSSNSWLQVWKKWKNDPLLREISEKWAEGGNYGAAGILNEFIETRLTRAVDRLWQAEALVRQMVKSDARKRGCFLIKSEGHCGTCDHEWDIALAAANQWLEEAAK